MTRPLVLPVIHHRTTQLSVAQGRLALEAGADGLFLIEMSGDAARPEAAAVALKAAFAAARIGMNRLGVDPLHALERNVAIGLDMTWTDTGLLNTDTRHRWPDARIEALRYARAVAGNHDLFVAVAFKYQPHDPDPLRSAREAVALGFVPTTSGPATGRAADPAAVAALRAGLGEAPLALASGVTPENVGLWLGHVTHVLVSTGIAPPDDEHRFDPPRLRALLDAARAAA